MVNFSPGDIIQLNGTDDIVLITVSLKDVLDFQALFLGKVYVNLAVTPWVNHRSIAARPDKVRIMSYAC
jgi:hypothetical protein